MVSPWIVAQETGFELPSGGEVFFWLLGAAVILGLWWVISRNRKRSYMAYWDRRKREEEARLNDPDMRKE